MNQSKVNTAVIIAVIILFVGLFVVHSQVTVMKVQISYEQYEDRLSRAEDRVGQASLNQRDMARQIQAVVDTLTKQVQRVVNNLNVRLQAIEVAKQEVVEE